VDAEEGEPDEVEFGDVGEDNVGEGIILNVLAFVKSWGPVDQVPLSQSRLRAESRGRLRRRGTRSETRTGLLSQRMDCFLRADGQARIAVMSSDLHSLANSPFN
jgi:hypothetical protein